MSDEPPAPFPPPQPAPFQPPSIQSAPFQPPPVQPASFQPGQFQPGHPMAPPPEPAQPWPPLPPRGPGVRVPFAVPPAERDRKRMWISLGVGGAALLLCCVGGVVGFGALVVTTSQATVTEARNTVRDFLDGLAKHDYHEAYDQVCTARQSDQTLNEFTEQERALPEIERFSLGQPVASRTQFQVPAVVQTPETTATERYLVISDGQAGGMRVCGGPR